MRDADIPGHNFTRGDTTSTSLSHVAIHRICPFFTCRPQPLLCCPGCQRMLGDSLKGNLGSRSFRQTETQTRNLSQVYWLLPAGAGPMAGSVRWPEPGHLPNCGVKQRAPGARLHPLMPTSWSREQTCPSPQGSPDAESLAVHTCCFPASTKTWPTDPDPTIQPQDTGRPVHPGHHQLVEPTDKVWACGGVPAAPEDQSEAKRVTFTSTHGALLTATAATPAGVFRGTGPPRGGPFPSPRLNAPLNRKYREASFDLRL